MVTIICMYTLGISVPYKEYTESYTDLVVHDTTGAFDQFSQQQSDLILDDYENDIILRNNLEDADEETRNASLSDLLDQWFSL